MPFDATSDGGSGGGGGPSLTGKLLIAMPSMNDPRFRRTVIYICAHSPDGALGLIINKHAGQISFPDLLEQLDMKCAPGTEHIRIQLGGPVETGRGFILHTDDYFLDGVTLPVREHVGLTTSLDILRDMAQGRGPQKALVALGYSGWGPGQLEYEIRANAWLPCDADSDLIFSASLDTKWDAALARLGINPGNLSGDSGRA
ncbi:MAG: YqgE/AlgH family protein [Alphaproteobacteria bacterium]|nr:YqgE/AlgH family protein [Alphaproteobacteria bacterium]